MIYGNLSSMSINFKFQNPRAVSSQVCVLGARQTAIPDELLRDTQPIVKLFRVSKSAH